MRPRLLTQLRRKHLLHVRLAAEIGDLRLGGQERIGTGCAHRNLVLHLVGSLKNDVCTLIGDQGCLEILLPKASSTSIITRSCGEAELICGIAP